MRSLFRAFSAHRVRYLIIGGQASILYGAAHFSQDLDVWIEPTDGNLRRFVDSLTALGARFHKLTPPDDEAVPSTGPRLSFPHPREGRRRVS